MYVFPVFLLQQIRNDSEDEEKDKNFNTLFLTNLNQQVRYLRFFVEIHLLANHFFENIKL